MKHVHGYLLFAMFVLFGLGLYELFVNKIDEAEGSDFARRLLLISSLDDLKDQLARVILIGGSINVSHLRSGNGTD